MRKTLVALLMLVLALTAAQAQTFNVLYNFGTNNGDPYKPQWAGIVAQGQDGNLYSTALGGVNSIGAMFKITPSGTLTVPYNFDLTDEDAYSGLTLGTDGNFYGATAGGGTSGFGTIYKVTPSGTLTVLHSFSGSDGYAPFAPPIEGTDGNFYGTTQQGGANALYGVVYKITSSGAFTLLHSFDSTDGSGPVAPLVQGSDGNFYGTTVVGGANTSYGEVFKVTASGQLTVIYSFDGTHGGEPYGPLVQGSDGNFYGTTLVGGSIGYGEVFRITAAGKLTVLHNLNGNTDGDQPFGGLVQATDGNFYGTTEVGGLGYGTIFQVNPTPPYPYKVIYNFDGNTAANPLVTLTQHTNGILYGDTLDGGTGNVGCALGLCGTFYSLKAGLRPFTSLLPYSGKVAKTIEFLGQGFTGTTGVSFNGTAATFSVISDTYLTATVPSGATTGSVKVTTPKGTLTSNKKFRVTPQVLRFSPPSGPVGTVVTITGVSLTQTEGVGFGDHVPASFTVNSDTQVTATVPTGAKTGPVGVETKGGIALSSTSFTVTQ
jgi:uncharacterized repeat protein (TIGR03803 family)